MLNQIYIHYINTLFVLESFIISCWLLKGKKIGIGIGIGQFARKKSVSESATKNHDRCITIFISCLDSHSDGTHSLQMIHWWASDVKKKFSDVLKMSHEETNSSTIRWPEGIFSKCSFMGELFICCIAFMVDILSVHAFPGNCTQLLALV